MEINHTYIIAEAGVNHNGSLDMARKLVEAAAESGADAVKFQTFKAERLLSRSAPKAEYQLRTTDAGESQYAMIRKLELDASAHEVLIDHCRTCNIQFLSTPFDLESVDLFGRTVRLCPALRSLPAISPMPLCCSESPKPANRSSSPQA